MSRFAVKLSLGALPRSESVMLTFAMTVELKAQLDVGRMSLLRWKQRLDPAYL